MPDKMEDLFQRTIAEIREFGDRPIHFELGMTDLLPMIGLIQLGLRHPDTANSPSANICRAMIEGIARELKDYPAIQETIANGFNPDWDQ